MSTINPESLLSWANPDENEFIGYAFSEEHCSEITQEVTRMRSRFAYDALRDELLRRDGAEVLENTGEINFDTLPVKFVLTRDECLQLAQEHWNNHEIGGGRPLYSENELKSYWTRLAEVQARLDGHRVFTTKNDNFYYTPSSPRMKQWTEQDEKRFQEMAADAEFIYDSGYPVRFLVEGVQYVQNAALDMTTVEQWVATRDEQQYPRVYWTPHGFWPTMVEAKRALDEERGRKTYADVVTSSIDHVFIGQYIDPAISASPEYFHFDDIYSAAITQGYPPEHLATRALRTLVRLTSDSTEQFEELRNTYFRQPNNGGRPGVFFFHVDILPQALDIAEDQKLNGMTIDLLELLEEQFHHPEEYDHLVFR